MIKEDYVSFETAKLLKEKGVECATHYYYDKDGDLLFSAWSIGAGKNECSAPTFQMAMKWLREKKDLYIQPQILNDGTYIAYIYRTDGFGLVGHDKRRVRNSPEEACEEAIKYCLENLI